MAVVVSEGYSAQACRELLAQMPGRCGEDLRLHEEPDRWIGQRVELNASTTAAGASRK